MRSFDPWIVSLCDDETDLSPTEWVACEHPRCHKVYRSTSECSVHGRVARAVELARSIDLERKLILSLTGGTTDAKVLSRLRTLELRARVLRNYEAPVSR